MSDKDKKSGIPEFPNLDLPEDKDLKSSGVEVPDGKTAQETMDDLSDTLDELPAISLEPLMDLQEQIRQQIEGAVVESITALEDSLVVKIRDERGQLRLLLMNPEGSDFDEFGGKENDKPVDEETIKSTFEWLKGDDRKEDDFSRMSEYQQNVMKNQEKEAVNQ